MKSSGRAIHNPGTSEMMIALGPGMAAEVALLKW